MKKVFVTGITGKSGRFLFEEILRTGNSDDFSFTFLVRSEEKAEWVRQKYPPANILIADLDDEERVAAELHRGYDTLLHIANLWYSPYLVKAAAAGGAKWVILVHTTGIFSKHKAAGEIYRQKEREVDAVLQGSGAAKTILRPTMIHGTPDDGNVSVFASMLRRFRIFPVVNGGRYELQPVWCADLGKAYYQVLTHEAATRGKEYNLSGKEPILLIDMLKALAAKNGTRNRFVSVPFWLAYAGAWGVHLLSLGKWDFREKVQRLVEPRAFSHADAARDFGYSPAGFEEAIELMQ